MAIKKSELYSSLWKSCDELRGGMDASQYKDYVLILLFVKYVSDKYAGNPNALIDIPAGGSFADMVAAKGDKEIGDKVNKIIGRLADANDSLKGAINVADFNDEEKLGKGKEMVDRLSKLVSIFEGLDFGSNRAEGDDLLGDAYEYLMRHFATESGKSKGQFYTPAEVSRVMSMVIDLGRANSGAACALQQFGQGRGIGAGGRCGSTGRSNGRLARQCDENQAGTNCHQGGYRSGISISLRDRILWCS